MASRRYDYFAALVELTDMACKTAVYFDNVINSFDFERLPTSIKEIHEIEHAADHKRHEIMENIAKEFLPPIEREDLIDLASTIDDVIDGIDDIMQHLYMYNVKELLPECKDFSKLIIQCCESIKNIAKEFHRFQKSQTIHQNIIITNNLESEGDRLYFSIMRRIFTASMSDLDTFVWARLIRSFEDCCDFCEHTAEKFDTAIMKNS